jgi:hypothetical protein
MHQFIGTWGTAVVAYFLGASLLDLLGHFGWNPPMRYPYWILTETPYYPVQIALGLYFGVLLGHRLHHRSMVWVRQKLGKTMLTHFERFGISQGRRILFAIALIALSSRMVRPQSNKIEPRLAGMWHSVEIRCEDPSDDECSNAVNEAQLSIDKTGRFEWMPYRDLERLDLCEWHISPDAPNTLDWDDCDVDPYQRDQFVYRLSGNTLTLTGLDLHPSTHKFVTMRFERGPLVNGWREPEPEICNTAPLPSWAASAKQIPSDVDLESPPTGVSDPQRLIPDRNRLLWDAVKASSGSAAPIALKAISDTIEGDTIEEYLFASRGEVEVVVREDEGIIQHLSTCARRVPMIKLKVQDSGKLWRFATSAPSPVTRAYIVFPGDGSGPHTFPRF